MPDIKARTPQELERVVGRVLQLQALPTSVQNITRIIGSSSSTADDVGREIGKDPAFSAQVLKLVNSGFYGFSQPVRSISHATVLLGFNVMKTLVMSASVVGMFAGSIEGLWPHSLACARACALLARTLGMEAEDVSAIGLLHDIGKVVEAEYLKPEFAAVVALVRSEDLLIREAEQRVMGLTHAEVARWLLARWNLPPGTVEPIARHHAFDPAGAHASQTAIVHLADILVRACGYGSGGDRRLPVPDPAALACLDLDASDLEPLVDEMMVELSEFE